MAAGEYHTLKELPESERPRERLALYGAAALSNAELLAIALRVGSPNENAVSLAQRLLATFGGLAGISQAGVSELCAVPGIGPSKAAQVKAALELGRRLILSAEEGRPQIKSPADAANLFTAAMAGAAQEELRVMLLDNKHRVLRVQVIYVGSVNTAVVRIAEIYRPAIRENAVAIIVAHNHPSGDATPSSDDVRVTEEMVRAGRLLDIELLDHLIVARQGYVSLKERGLGFSI